MKPYLKRRVELVTSAVARLASPSVLLWIIVTETALFAGFSVAHVILHLLGSGTMLILLFGYWITSAILLRMTLLVESRRSE